MATTPEPAPHSNLAPHCEPKLASGVSGKAPVLTRTRAELRAALADLEARGHSRALVMTMGALHEGHMTLVREAKRHADEVVVSIYVNPLQFGPNEDFDSYPRTLDADLALLAQEGVAVVFAPEDAEMYPGWPQLPAVRIDPGELATRYEGATRPGHFAGVAQVVAKVISLVSPVVSVFGQKDAQQLAVIRSLVADLDLPGRIVAAPISRDPDGLAQSSRNTYLSAAERERALTLSRALRAGEAAAGGGGGDARAVYDAAWEVLTASSALGDETTDSDAAARLDAVAAVPFEIDYLALVDATRFTPLVAPRATGELDAGAPAATGERRAVDAVLAVAVRVGPTRLIDNVPVRVAV